MLCCGRSFPTFDSRLSNPTIVPHSSGMDDPVADSRRSASRKPSPGARLLLAAIRSYQVTFSRRYLGGTVGSCRRALRTRQRRSHGTEPCAAAGWRHAGWRAVIRCAAEGSTRFPCRAGGAWMHDKAHAAKRTDSGTTHGTKSSARLSPVPPGAARVPEPRGTAADAAAPIRRGQGRRRRRVRAPAVASDRPSTAEAAPVATEPDTAADSNLDAPR